MEKAKEEKQPVKSKNLFMRFLPKAATSSVNFNNPTYSPNREKRSHAHRGFSGPFMMIPVEARRQSTDEDTSFGRREDPTSPKVSCMGQIKQKHKLHGAKRASSRKKDKESKVSNSSKKKQTSLFGRICNSKKKKKNDKNKNDKKKSYSSSDEEEEEFRDDATARKQNKTVPSTLGQMKRFASTRDAFANFDWTAQVTPVNTDDPEDRNCYSDEEKMHSDEESDVDEFMIPFSAPMFIGGNNKMELEPRKEINLWKRRTMVPPRPLNMNAPIRSK